MKTYPDIDIRFGQFEKGEFGIKLHTEVRLQDKNGVWFKCPVSTGLSSVRFKDSDHLQSIINFFMRDCEMTRRFYIVSEEMKHLGGEPYFKRDSDQRSEDERLKDYIHSDARIPN
jgi:hypothetical protein